MQWQGALAFPVYIRCIRDIQQRAALCFVLYRSVADMLGTFARECCSLSRLGPFEAALLIRCAPVQQQRPLVFGDARRYNPQDVRAILHLFSVRVLLIMSRDSVSSAARLAKLWVRGSLMDNMR